MAIESVQSAGYVQVANNNTGEVYNIPVEEFDVSVFGGKEQALDNIGDKFNVDRACTDGDNDGKISVGQALKSAFKGVANLVTAPVTEALKGNFLPLIGTVAVGGAIALIGAPAAVAAGAIGLCVGGANIVSSVFKAIDADTDGEAKAAFEQMGAGGFTVLASAAGLKSGLKSMKASDTTNLGKYYDNNGKLTEAGKSATFGEKTSAYFKDLGDSTKNAFTKINPLHGKDTAVDADDALVQVQEVRQTMADEVSAILNEQPNVTEYEFPRMTAEEAGAIVKTGPSLGEVNPELINELLGAAAKQV